MKQNLKSIIDGGMTILAVLITAHVLLCYFGSEWTLYLLVILSLIYLKLRWKRAVMLSVSFAIPTVCFVWYLHCNPQVLYFRPDNKLMGQPSQYSFKKEQQVSMMMNFGDIVALSGRGEGEPRWVRFQTDSDGYRNFKNYHGQGLILLGDSFVVGSGSSQEWIISEQLMSQYGVDVYNLGFPTDLVGYWHMLEKFNKRHKGKWKVLLFIFEGNDFLRPVDLKSFNLALSDQNKFSFDILGWMRNYGDYFGQDTYRFVQNRYARLFDSTTDSWHQAEEALVGGKTMWFLKKYVDGIKNPSNYDDATWQYGMILEHMKPFLERVYYIPDKFRVYGHFTENSQAPYFQTNQTWEYLKRICDNLDIPVTNLTDDLIRKAGKLMLEGKFLYWRDDTHWNRYGIQVAADAIAHDLKLNVNASQA